MSFRETDRELAERLRVMLAALPARSAPALEGVERRRSLAWLPRLAGGVAALVLVVVVVGIGLFVSGRLPLPGGISAHDGTFAGGGLRFEYPREWKAYPSTMVSTRGSVFAVLGTADLGACNGLGGIDANCAYAARLEPGRLRVVVGTGAAPGFSILDREPPGGWQLLVDGLPATVEETGPSSADSSDANVTWTIAMPGSLDNFYYLSASIRGPGLEEMRAQLDALVASMRYDQPPVPLPTGADASASATQAVTRALNAIDRSSRDYWSDWYGCFPREPGSSQTSVVTGGPGNPGPRLTHPLTVTCTVSVEPTPLQLWRVALEASWTAGSDYAAGSYQEVHYLAADGEQVGYRPGEFPPGPPLAGLPPTPAPVAGPVRLTVGQLAEIVDPGATVYLSPDRGDILNNLALGTRVFVVAGPQSIDGVDWYLVQWPPSRSYVPVLGWMPAKVEGRPQAETLAPSCPPNPTLAELVDMAWGERLLCFGDRPITLTGVMAVDEAPDLDVDGEPGWLAVDSSLRLYDEFGPGGVGGSMPVHVDPGSGLDLPVGSVMNVTGHFDDPTASGCTRAFIDAHASGLVEENPDAQVLRCRENFVVTSVSLVR